VICLYVT